MFNPKSFSSELNKRIKIIDEYEALIVSLFGEQLNKHDEISLQNTPLDELTYLKLGDSINKVISYYNQLVALMNKFEIRNPVNGVYPTEIRKISGLSSLVLKDVDEITKNHLEILDVGLTEIDNILKLQNIKKEEMNGDI